VACPLKANIEFFLFIICKILKNAKKQDCKSKLTCNTSKQVRTALTLLFCENNWYLVLALEKPSVLNLRYIWINGLLSGRASRESRHSIGLRNNRKATRGSSCLKQTRFQEWPYGNSATYFVNWETPF